MSSLLKRIANARDVLREARKLNCTCSNFSIQYDGCMCAKAKEMAKAEKDLQTLIDSIGGEVKGDVFVTNKEDLPPTPVLDVRLADNTIGDR